jgi:hypothetical protein
MAGEFGFHKGVDPAFPNFTEDGGILDLQTSILTFQMVPLLGRRMAIASGPIGQACQVVIDAPRVVEFGKRTFQSLGSSRTIVAPPTLDRFLQPLPAGLQMTFEISALAAGRTNILLESAGGGGLASLQVSVKSESKVTISACRLMDVETVNKFDDISIRATMARAKATFKNTANVLLVDDPTIYKVESDISLGNPVVLGQAFTEYDTKLSTVFRHIVSKTPPAAKAADLVAVFGWDFELTHQPLVGLNSGRFCFVEHDPVAHNRNMTLAHEVGHAMGLGHTKVRSIMNGDGFNGVERFEADEIEILNKSGSP